jgi:two-component system KDP operon response regulator KdpE
LRRIDCPDLILLDLMMPAMNGSDLLSVIRVHEKFATTPIIVMSAWLHTATARVTGADHVLPKPLNVDQLLALIKHYCAPSTRRKSTTP